jgi:hypothetical protein
MPLFKLILITSFVFTLTTVNGQTKKQTHFSFSVGFGINNYTIKKSDWIQPPINYNDSLNSIDSKSSVGIYLGISYYLNLTEKISLRPGLILGLPSTGELKFERKTITEILDLRSITEEVSIPINYKFTTKRFKPYLSIGPSFSFLIGQGDDTKAKVEFNTFDLLAQIGVGGEIPFKQFKIKPELQFSAGLLEMRKSKANIYNNTISKLQRQNFTLTFYLCSLWD